MKKGIISSLEIPLPSAPAPPKIEPPIEEPSSSSTCPTALASPITLATLQGICVFQLPFPGVLSEKDQREKLSAVAKKYSRNFEIRFDAVPNTSIDATPHTGGRRFQPLPLIRRALIVIQKLANCEPLLNELNRLTMVGCQLKASMATTEDLTSFIATRAAKPSILLAPKPPAPPVIPPNPTAEFQAKRPQNLLRLPIISPPAAAVKAMIFDTQNHGIPDPFSKNASRTLYIKHLETNVNEEELKARYGKFGHILDIEVKNRNTLAPYAFIQYTNIESVSSAIKQSNLQQSEDIITGVARQKKSSTHHWWGNTIVSNRLWVGLLPPKCGEQYLASKVRVVLTSPEHDITKVDYDPAFNEAVLIFTGHEAAQIVFNKIKMGQIKFQPESSTGSAVQHIHVHVDFCSEKLHSYFVDRLFHKSVEIVVNPGAPVGGLLPSPPEQPRLPPVNFLKKASPSPPPDPSTESIERRHSISVHAHPRPSSSLDRTPEVNHPPVGGRMHQQQAGTSTTTTTENIAYKRIEGNEVQPSQASRGGGKQHNKETAAKQPNKQQERRATMSSSKRSRSSSTSSESSTDTYNQPRRKWRHPSQHHQTKKDHTRATEQLDEHGGGGSSNHQRQREKTWKKQPKETRYSWSGHKHRTHRSTERAKTKQQTDPRSSHRESRRLKRHERKTEHNEKTTSREYNKPKALKRSGTEGKEYHRKYRSRADVCPASSILPPPPVPPTRMDRVEQQHSSATSQPKPAKARSVSSCSSSSNTSCSSYTGSESCSTCAFDEESNAGRNRQKEEEEESSSGSGSTSLSNCTSENEGEEDGHEMKQKRKAQDEKPMEMAVSASQNEEKVMDERISAEPANISMDSTKSMDNVKSLTGTEIQLPKSEQKLEKQTSVAGSVQRVDSISSELAHKKSAGDSVPTPGPAPSSSTCSLTARLRTLLRSHVTIPLTQTDTSITLVDPRKRKPSKENEQQIDSLEIPRFALKLKLLKKPENIGAHHQQNEHKLTIELKQPKKEESTDDPSIILGTPISATPTIATQKHEQHLEKGEDRKQFFKENQHANKAQKQCHSISSFTKADFLLKDLYEKIKNRRADLHLDKIPKKSETNIMKVEEEMQKILELFSGTSLEELPNLIARSSLFQSQQHHQTPAEPLCRRLEAESEQKMEFDEQPNELLRPHAIGSSFSSERANIPPHHEQPAGTSESHERRNTLPAKAIETALPIKPAAHLLPRPRASSSGFSQAVEETHSSAHHKSCEMGSPKMETSNKTTVSIFAKPKIEKEESSAGTSPLSKPLSLVPVKKIHQTILKKPSTPTTIITSSQQQNVDKEKHEQQHQQQLNKQTGTTSASLVKTCQQKLVEHRKSSHQLSLVSRMVIEQHKKIEEREKALMKKEHKDKDMKTKTNLKCGPTSSSTMVLKKIPSSNKDDKRVREEGEVKKIKSFSVGSKDQLKSTLKPKGSSEADADSDGKSRKKKRRKHETSSSEEDDEEEAAAGLFDIDLEEQKKIMEAIKSGKTDGLSMYDRVKRRSSKRPDEEKKKATALEQLREKQAKKKKELGRVRLMSTSDTDGSKGSAAPSTTTSTSAKHPAISHRQKQTTARHTDQSELDEDIEINVVDDSLPPILLTKMNQHARNRVEEKQTTRTIRKPEIAPKKPMIMAEDEDKHRNDADDEEEEEEEAGSKNFSSSVEWNLSVSSDGDEREDSSKIGDKVVRKLKMEFDRHRSNSQSSRERHHKDNFDQKLARVMEIAKEGQKVQNAAEHDGFHLGEASSSSGRISSSSNSSSSFSSDEEGQRTILKGFPVFKKRAPKKITSLSLEDVFGEDSDEHESPMEETTGRKEGTALAPSINQSQNDRIPKMKDKSSPKKSTEMVKHLKPAATEEKHQHRTVEKDKKRIENLHQKSASIIKESPKHTSDLKRLKRQSPIRSTSIDDIQAKLKDKEREKTTHKRVKEENVEPSILTKRRKSMIAEKITEKHPSKGIKRQQIDEDGNDQRKIKHTKLDNILSKPSTSQEKEHRHHRHKHLMSPEKDISKQPNTSAKVSEGLKNQKSESIEEKKPESKVEVPKENEMDSIGLLGIWTAEDEFEVIDSGKVTGSGEKAKEEKTEGRENVKEAKKKVKTDAEREKEEEQAELLRKMEQNEEEEAVAALKLQTTINKRNSQDGEDGNSNLANFMKPIERNWPPTMDKMEEEASVKEVKMAEDGAESGLEVRTEEKKDGTAMLAGIEKGKNASEAHESIERRPSNESIDAQIVSIGSGFVEVDAEVLKEQQEKERLAEEKVKLEEDERRKSDEAKRLEATVDFVASSAARESGIIKGLPQQQIANPAAPTQQQTTAFMPTQTEFVVKVQPDHHQQQQPTAAILQSTNLQIDPVKMAVPNTPPVHSLMAESSLQQQSTIFPQQPQKQQLPKQQAHHHIGVIVSEAPVQPKTSSATPITVVQNPTSGSSSNLPPPAAANIYVHLQPDQQQKLTNQYVPTVQPLNVTSDVSTNRHIHSAKEAAAASATSTSNLFIQAFEQQQQQSKMVIPQQLGVASTSQIGNQQQLRSQQQPKPAEKKLSQALQVPKKASIQQQQQSAQFSNQQQQIEQQLWQNQMAQQQAQHAIQQHYQQNQPIQQQQQYQQQQESMLAQIRIQQQQQNIGQMPQNAQQNLSKQQQQASSRQQLAVDTQEQQRQQQQQAVQIQQLQQQQQQADQLAAAAAAAVASSGLMDSAQMLQLYQRFMLTGRDPQTQMLTQQMPNLSAAMMAAAASNQLNSAALAKWHNLFSTPTSSSTLSPNQNNGASINAIEGLLRQTGLLGHPSMAGMPATPGALPNQGGMTAATLEELYRQHYMASSSPRLQQPPPTQQQQTVPLQTSIQANAQKQHHEQLERNQLLQHHGQQQPSHRTQIPPVITSNPTHHQQQHTHLNTAPLPPSQPQRTATSSAYQKQPIQQLTNQSSQNSQPILQPVEQQPQKVQKQNTQAAPLWQGQLAMKNADTLVIMHKVCGNEQLMERMNRELVAFNDKGIHLLRITQRMRLEPSQLESVLRKMDVEENYIALICFPCGVDRNDITVQTEKMQKAFIDYFLQKSAAGIASMPPNSCVAHIFAPDQFIKSLLAKNAPDILKKVEHLNAAYLFVILTNT